MASWKTAKPRASANSANRRRAEKVCHGVLENREAARERQFRQQAPGAAILDAERLSVYATGWRRADPGEGIEPAQQPLAVDLRH
ncbi:hypothetical protein X773_26345 [Mesorhizobium sp. LSJC285A00]|nr:hypothetical protein X773_26345 [Mesorhizobium sp. LSJC285A00]